MPAPHHSSRPVLGLASALLMLPTVQMVEACVLSHSPVPRGPLGHCSHRGLPCYKGPFRLLTFIARNVFLALTLIPSAGLWPVCSSAEYGEWPVTLTSESWAGIAESPLGLLSPGQIMPGLFASSHSSCSPAISSPLPLPVGLCPGSLPSKAATCRAGQGVS